MQFSTFSDEEIGITLSWSQVEQKFFKRYVSVFDASTVAAHLDSCGNGKVIGKILQLHCPTPSLEILTFFLFDQTMQNQDGKILYF
jgi:hypothetical protein